ncbi:tumor necrosis factor ligand superfamily member 18 [Rhynchocyon petersi]
MNLSHMENMALNHSNPQGALRSSWKLRLFFPTILILLPSLFIVPFFLFLSPKTDICLAKFGPLPTKWKTQLSEPHCMDVKADWELKILKSGLFAIHSHVVPNTTYKEQAPFLVQLYKNDIPIISARNNSETLHLGGIYELHAGDIIALKFNHDYQVLKNDTYLLSLLLESSLFIF